MKPTEPADLTLRNQELLGWRIRRAARAATRLTAVTSAVVLLLGAVAASPLVLLLIDRGGGDWSRLSDVGQTYGAVSALLSALAVAGVALSLLMQRRQARLDQIRATRQAHEAIMRLPYENPRYGQCWGPAVSDGCQDERLFYYVNSILNYWYDAWNSGDLSSERLRRYSATMFQSEVPRRYWDRFGPVRRDLYGHRARFFRLLDEQYRKAVAAGPAVRSYQPLEESRPPEHHVGAARDPRLLVGVGMALGLVAAVAGAAVIEAIHSKARPR